MADLLNNHKVYDNFILENKIEDMLATHVDMNNYLTADYSLSENPGMLKKIHKYSASGDVEDLAMGEGNSDQIEVTFSEEEYRVGVTQGKFQYYDEQAMTDPMVVETGLAGITAKFANDLTSKAIAEFGKGSRVFYGAQWKYDDIVDAIAMYPYEEEDGLFLLINPAQKAAFRKNLGEDLKYVEANVRTGYIGTICGVPVIVSKAVPAGKAFLATRAAVTAFIKKGVEVEQEREANIRNNKVFARKVALVALTDDTRLVRLSANSDPREGYKLVAEKPADWDTDFASYFKYDVVKEELAACASAEDWAAGKIYEAE